MVNVAVAAVCTEKRTAAVFLRGTIRELGEATFNSNAALRRRRVFSFDEISTGRRQTPFLKTSGKKTIPPETSAERNIDSVFCTVDCG